MGGEPPGGPAPLGKANRTFGWVAGIGIAILLVIGIVSWIVGEGATIDEDDGSQDSLSVDTTVLSATPVTPHAPTAKDLCVGNPECRLDVESEGLQFTLNTSNFVFDIQSRADPDGYRFYTAYSEPPGVIVEWLEYDGVVWVWVLAPEPSVVLRMGDNFEGSWSHFVRGIASDVVPSPWGTDIAFWIMNTWSESRVVNGVLIEINYLSALESTTIEFRKAP